MVLVLGACSNRSGDDAARDDVGAPVTSLAPPSSPSTVAPPEPAAVPASTVAVAASTTTLAPTPLEALFGTAEEQLARNRLVEQQVATCMTVLGWQYIAVDPAATGALEPGGDAFRSRYGYGITTFIAGSGGGGDALADEPGDPNAPYVAALSLDERDRYVDDLYGPPDEAAGDPGSEPAATQGCLGEARALVYGSQPGLAPELSERLDRALAGIDDDGRVVRATLDWGECLRAEDPAWDFAEPEDVQPYLEGELSATDVDDEPALTALQDQERALAAADHACQQQHLIDVVRAVRIDVEQRFIDDNLDVVLTAGPSTTGAP